MTPDSLDLRLRRARREPLWQPGPATRAVGFQGEALERLVRHRPPFLLVDAITAYDLDQGAIAGRRRVDPADPVLAGHFPGNPVYPGVLLLEAMAQVLAALGPLLVDGPAEDVFAASCRAVFLQAVYPGDALVLLAVRIGAHDGLYSRGIAQVLRGDQICAAAILEGCHVGP